MTPFPLDAEIEIARSCPEVFAFLADPGHLPAWRPGVHRVSRTPNGAYLHAGRRTGWAYKVTGCEPPAQLSARLTSAAMTVEETYRLDGTASGTRVRYTASVQATGRRAWLGPLLRAVHRRQVRAGLRRLKFTLGRGPLPVEREGEPVTPA